MFDRLRKCWESLPGWLTGVALGVVSFLAGVIFQPVVAPTILPWAEPLGERIADWIHAPPPSVWKTDRVGGCISGDIGNRAAAAERAGYLLEIGVYTDQVWVCGDHAFDNPLLIARFDEIARQYPSCFGFDNEAKRWLGISLGWLGITNRRFWVDPASPAVCSTGLNWREGERRFIRTDYTKGRLICMGDAEYDYIAQDHSSSTTPVPRPCNDREMHRYGFDRLETVN